MTPRRPRKPAAAAPQPEHNPAQPKLPRVWQIVFYSEEEVQMVGLALSAVQMQIAVPEKPSFEMLLEQIALQQQALRAGSVIANRMGGFDWLNGLRHRFATLAKSIAEEEGR